MIAKKRIYLTADRSRVVAEDDPLSAVLLIGIGGTISDEDVERYGLKEDEPATLFDEPEQEAAPAKKARKR